MRCGGAVQGDKDMVNADKNERQSGYEGANQEADRPGSC